MEETRYYLVDINKVPSDFEKSILHISDEEFMELSEMQGTVYTQVCFQNAFNNEEMNTDTQFLRIIDTKI